MKVDLFKKDENLYLIRIIKEREYVQIQLKIYM